MKEMILRNLKSLDLNLRTLNRDLEIVIIGGGALILNDKIDRETTDIDSFIKVGNEFHSFDEDPLFEIANDLTINSAAENVVPSIYELFSLDDKMIEYNKTNFSKLKIYLPSMELISFLKILAASDRGTRKHDYTDLIWVKSEIESFDFKHLQKFIEFYFDRYNSESIQNKFNQVYEKWMDWLFS